MTSGSFNTSLVGNFYFTFEWSRTNYDSTKNEHYISWTLKAHNTAGKYRTVYLKNLYVNGVQRMYETGGVRYYNDNVVASGTTTVTSYNDAGDGSFSASFEAGVGISSGSNCSGNGSWNLDRIPRQANVTSATNFNDEGNPTIKFNNYAGFRINARLEFGGVNIQRDNIPNTGSYTFSLTETERNLLRSKCTGNSMTVREVIATCISGTTESFWSWQDKTMTIVNANPIFSDFTFQDTNATVTAVTGNDQIIVKGLSTLQTTITSANKMTAQKQATPKNYGVTIDNINISANYSENDVDINVGTIPTSGVKRLNVRAYDSRNNSTLVYKDVIVYDYDKPIINATAERLNNFENSTILKINGSFSSLIIDSVEKNTIQTIQYRYRETNGTWENWTTVSPTIIDNSFSCNNEILTLDNTKSFEIEVQVVDSLQTNTATLLVDVGEAVFFISSNQRKCYINNDEILTKKCLVYSTSEVNTGETWIDDKPIYRKTFTGASISSNIQNIDVSDLNIDTVFFNTNKSYLNWSYGSVGGRYAPIIQTAVSRAGTTSEPDVGFYQSEVYTNTAKTTLTINCGKNMVIGEWAITIEYTKTTD